MDVIAILAAILSVIGIAQTIAGWLAVVRFTERPFISPLAEPPITVLKPLHGDEPLLEQALTTLCLQDYSDYQIVFGVQDATDSAIPVVQRLRAAFPGRDIALVVDRSEHGPNRKIANLINMLPAAKHGVLAIADSDLHVRPDYLSDLIATLAAPNTGLATTLYVGLPASRRLAALLGATQITHGFLPGALLARAMGRQDCLGATMCLRRETLRRIGGLQALADHLADDNVLGQLVRGLGLDVRLAATVVATTVPEATFGALFRHELRWARTIRALVPGAFALSVLQYPIFWALVAVLASFGAWWAIVLFVWAWLARALAATGIDRVLAPRLEKLAFPATVGLLPLRELLSVATMLASHTGKAVDWRGHTMHAAGYHGTSPSSQSAKEL
jgi:ceramide glucosyltransferase